MLSKVNRMAPASVPRLPTMAVPSVLPVLPALRPALRTMQRSTHRVCCQFRCTCCGSLLVALFCLLFVSLQTIPCTAAVLRDQSVIHKNLSFFSTTLPDPSGLGHDHVESEPISTVHEENFLDPCKADAYMGDIALTSEDAEVFAKRNIPLSRKPHLPPSGLVTQRIRERSRARRRPRRRGRRKHRNRRRMEQKLRRKMKKQLRQLWYHFLRNNARKLGYSYNQIYHMMRHVPLKIRTGGKHRPRSQRPKRRVRRAATAYKSRVWPFGVIPYVIQSNFSSETKAQIKKAMRHWENYTCISFVERESQHASYILFTEKSCGCCSYVGRRSEKEPQAISIGKNCDKRGIIIHELGHVIGFWHEHTRPDRDDHVEILWDNVVDGQAFNFKKLDPGEVDSLGEPYDYNSIMHYAKGTFSKPNRDETIRPIACCPRPPIGQRIQLSVGDIRQTKKLYECPACGRSLLEPSAEFSSPEREHDVKPEGKDYHCQWRIMATEGERIMLNFTFFNIPESTNCAKEYLEVRDGYYIKSTLVGRYCGSSIPDTILSTGSRLWLEYHAVRSSSNRGFSAKYEALCGGEVLKDEGSLSSPTYPEYYQPNKECIWKITVPKQYSVALKFHTFQIEKHDNCVYDFVEIRDGADASAPLLGRFCGYQIPPGLKATNNQMYIRFMSDSSVQKQGFTGNFQKEFDECKSLDHGCQHYCVNTLGGYKCECRIGFELHSDGKKCEDACGGIINAPNGTIHSPSFPQMYPPNKNCIWQIQAPEKHRILLNFTHFQLEGRNKECEYDFVDVISGSGDSSKKIGTFCGDKIPQAITSHTNTLRIEFYSDASVQRKGFRAIFNTDRDECAENNGGCEHICRNIIGSYECACHSGYVLHGKYNCKEGGCRHDISVPEGTFFSPNYPDHYPSKKQCKWIFSTTPGHRVRITFDEFEIESHQQCAYDRIQLYDGLTAKSRSLGAFCGSKTPAAIEATNNALTLVFTSDGSVQRKGFKARHTSICGGHLVALSNGTVDLFSHAKFGDQDYPPNSICNWKLDSGAPNARLNLTFDVFDVEAEDTCVKRTDSPSGPLSKDGLYRSYDYVDVYDGLHSGSPLLSRYCGKHRPPVIISRGRYILIKFRSDDTISGKGFHLRIQPYRESFSYSVSAVRQAWNFRSRRHRRRRRTGPSYGSRYGRHQ